MFEIEYKVKKTSFKLHLRAQVGTRSTERNQHAEIDGDITHRETKGGFLTSNTKI